MKTFIKKSESISFEKVIKDFKKLQDFILNSELKNKKAATLKSNSYGSLNTLMSIPTIRDSLVKITSMQ